MKWADDKQAWDHESGGLLEYHEPGVVEVLSDALPHIQECILCLLNLVLDHPGNDVVGLIKLELELLSEGQKA